MQEEKTRYLQALALWEKTRAGDVTSFNELYRQHIQLLYNYGLKLAPVEIALIEDTLQELFIDLWNKRDQIHIRYSVKQYLFLSFRRLLFRKMTQQKKRPVSIDIQGGQFDFSFGLPNTDVDGDPRIQLQRKEKLARAMASLSKRQKEAIFLKYYENLDYEEIAGVMEISVKAVYKLVSTGIIKLRSQVK